MRIIFFIDSLGAGGKERRLTELLKGLSSKRTEIAFEVVVLDTNIHYEEVLNLGVNIHQIKRKSRRDLSIFPKAYRICQDFKPDILHCWDSMSAIYTFLICKLLNIKLVNGMVTDAPVKRSILNKSIFRAKLTFPFSDVIIGNSKAGLSAYRAPLKKSTCIYSGIDLNRLNNLKDPSLIRRQIFGNGYSRLFVIGMVASFEEKKDYGTLLKAAEPLIAQYDSVRFILIGDGSKLVEIKNGVPVKMLDKIIFMGRTSDVDSIVNIFDVGILLTNAKVHGEGISNAIIEYMAAGKPVIATRGGGTDEVVIPDQNGYLIDPGNDGQLREKIEILINNQNYMNTLGKNGLEMVCDRFDLKLMTSKYISVYQSILTTSHERR